MAATVWKGHLTFGLVSIPVRLFRAARAEKVRMHQLYRPQRTEAARADVIPIKREEPQERELEPEPERGEEITPVQRIRQVTVDPVEETPVPRSDLVRGYEYAKNQYVVVEREELRKITPQTSTEMQIVEFVRFNEIDAVYLETSYYMAPEEAGEKAYALLFEGMRQSGYAAVTQVAMHRREHIMILRPGRTGIIAHTMFYPDEVRSIQEFRTDVSLAGSKELALAKVLIETLAAPFEPAKFKDTYRERLQQLIDARVETHAVAAAAPQPITPVVDIMEALQKSLAAVKSKAPRKTAKSERPAPSGKRQRTVKGS